MPATGYTPIVSYHSSTAGVIPSASNLTPGELAVNIADKRIFTKTDGGAVVELGTAPSVVVSSSSLQCVDRAYIGATASYGTPSTGSIQLGTSRGRKIELTQSSDYHLGIGHDVSNDLVGYELDLYYPVGPLSEGTIRIGTVSTGNPGTWSEKVRITSSGTMLVGKTTATSDGGDVQVSKGITFPASQVTSTDPNTLDDYEEGTWTPVFSATGLSVSYDVNNGSYVKIGKRVFCDAYLHVRSCSGGSSAALKIAGLPFTPASGYRGFSGNLGVSAFTGQKTLFIEDTSVINIYDYGTVTATPSSELIDGNTFYLLSISYNVAG